MSAFRFSKFLLSVSVLLLLSFSYTFCSEVTITESELNTLKTALITADEALQTSEKEIANLKTRLSISLTESAKLSEMLKTQSNQLATLETQLKEASTSLQKLKNVNDLNYVKIYIAGALGIVFGGALMYLFVGGK